MHALVIGASGLVGGALSRALEHSGATVATTYCSRAVDGSIELDLRDEPSVRRCFAAVKPEVVFLAVNTRGGVDYCETHPAEAELINVRGTEWVVAAAAECHSRVVYYSTDYIFDGLAGPYNEGAIPNPLNAYGRTKLEAERIVGGASSQHLILRTTAVFGWDRTSRNVAMQLWESLQAGRAMRVPHDQWTTPTLADQLAEVSVRLVEAGVKGIVNIAGADVMSRADLATALARTMALDPTLVVPTATSELGQAAARPSRGGLRTDRLVELVGTEPLGFTESLKRFRRQWRTDTHVSVPVPAMASNKADQIKQDIFKKVAEYHRLVHEPRSFVPFTSRVPYAGRVFGTEEMINLVDSALDFWLTLGPYGDLFERRMQQFFGANGFVFVSSGSTANLAAVMALMSPQLDRPLKAGDEVVTPAVTFPTTIAPIVQHGLIPVLVDAEIGTYNINPHLIEQAIGPKTRALFVPHTLGNPCDLDLLADIAKRYELYLIEDCCDALGGTFGGRKVGTFGDLATLSFYPAHHLTVGEGGGVVVNRRHLERIVRSVRDWGRDCWCAPGESNSCGRRFGWELGELPCGYDHKYTYSNIGSNLKPTDLQAAIGVAQVDRLPAFIAARRRNFARLYAGLAPYQDRLVLPIWDSRAEPSWFGFPITVRDGVSRAELVQWLETANIETRQIFAGNVLKQPGYRQAPARIATDLHATDQIMRDAFFVGVYPGLTEPMIDFILERFRAFFAQ